jgi:uncharacterized membrane protein YkoI
MRFKCVFYGLATLGILSLSAGASFAYTGQKLAGKAKIDIEQARSIALKARPGKITDEELEKEGGGSGLRYSFDVKSGNATYEVGVDARDGKVLENDKEGPNAD